MTNLKIRREVTSKIADIILKGEDINPYFIELICKEEVSVKEIADQILTTIKGKREYKTQNGVLMEICKRVVKTHDPLLMFNFAQIYKENIIVASNIGKGLIQSNNILYMTLFATEVDTSIIQEVIDIVSKAKVDKSQSDLVYKLYNCARNIKDINSEKLIDKVIEVVKIEDILELAISTDNKKLIEKVIKDGNEKAVYALAKNNVNISVDILAEAIIQKNEPKYIYLFARDIPKAPIEKLLDAILKFEDVKIIRFFVQAYNERLVHRIDEITDRIIEIGTNQDIFEFAIRTIGLDTNKILNAIIKTNNPSYICEYSKKLQGNNEAKQKLANALIEIGNVSYIYKFIKQEKEIDVLPLINKICDSKDLEIICNTASDIKEIPTELLRDAIIEADNPSYIIKFARDVKGQEKAFYDPLIQCIIEYENPYYILLFAQEVENVNLDKLVEAIIKTKQAEYIFKFAKTVKNAPIKKLISGIV